MDRRHLHGAGDRRGGRAPAPTCAARQAQDADRRPLGRVVGGPPRTSASQTGDVLGGGPPRHRRRGPGRLPRAARADRAHRGQRLAHAHRPRRARLPRRPRRPHAGRRPAQRAHPLRPGGGRGVRAVVPRHPPRRAHRRPRRPRRPGAPARRRPRRRGHERLDEAEQARPRDFTRNGWVVEALQAAWCAIATTPVPADDPAAGAFRAGHLRLALESAVRGGRDADTVAAIAGGLLGAAYGASAVPARVAAGTARLARPGGPRPHRPRGHDRDGRGAALAALRPGRAPRSPSRTRTTRACCSATSPPCASFPAR